MQPARSTLDSIESVHTSDIQESTIATPEAFYEHIMSAFYCLAVATYLLPAAMADVQGIRPCPGILRHHRLKQWHITAITSMISLSCFVFFAATPSAGFPLLNRYLGGPVGGKEVNGRDREPYSMTEAATIDSCHSDAQSDQRLLARNLGEVHPAVCTMTPTQQHTSIH